MHLRDAETGEPCEILCPCTDCIKTDCRGIYKWPGCSGYETEPTEINESTDCGTFTTDQIRKRKKAKRDTKEKQMEGKFANQFMIGGFDKK